MALTQSPDLAKGWSTLRSIESPPHFLPWVTGRFYTCPFDTTLTTASASNALMRGLPIYVPNQAGVTVTAIGLEITAGGTGSTARYAIYSMLPSGLPGNLVIDGGTTATTGTGFVSVSVSQLLRQGWYFIASVNTGTAPTIRRFTGATASLSFLGVQSRVETAAGAGYNAYNDATTCTDIVNNGFPGMWPVWSSQAAPATSIDRLMVGV